MAFCVPLLREHFVCAREHSGLATRCLSEWERNLHCDGSQNCPLAHPSFGDSLLLMRGLACGLTTNLTVVPRSLFFPLPSVYELFDEVMDFGYPQAR